jgi:hypothetical protein
MTLTVLHGLQTEGRVVSVSALETEAVSDDDSEGAVDDYGESKGVKAALK